MRALCISLIFIGLSGCQKLEFDKIDSCGQGLLTLNYAGKNVCASTEIKPKLTLKPVESCKKKKAENVFKLSLVFEDEGNWLETEDGIVQGYLKIVIENFSFESKRPQKFLVTEFDRGGCSFLSYPFQQSDFLKGGTIMITRKTESTFSAHVEFIVNIKGKRKSILGFINKMNYEISES
ncbi:hypothetical protein [Jiulongibacter sediminis]|uniref:Lipoprotein n=1 Tax=Jiulongibacter sediminis TaxID=1605367 RepID=A0A0P7C3Y7_9BACT|nr:hypothetical protein [Jiulongibacter sediminis]KPM47870.1 hypothetical protein AFM12_11565 [Jiulongibacter sediminis]TBX24054.1 hypothetical protein TK44_11570 [Jiulongibacter sediminis]